MPTVELVYDSDCPNVADARRQLLAAFDALGLTPSWREWDRGDSGSPDRVRRFGSPTILVDGKDVAGGEATDAACCRIYRSEGDALSGVPPLEQIKAALASAVHRGYSRFRADWKSLTPVLPAFGVALLPKLTCPACWPAYAALLSALGVGFVDYTPAVVPATFGFVALSLVFLGRNSSGNYGPLVIGAVAGLAILAGKFMYDFDTALYGGIGLLAAASVWRARPRAGAPACPACVESPAQPSQRRISHEPEAQH